MAVDAPARSRILIRVLTALGLLALALVAGWVFLGGWTSGACPGYVVDHVQPLKREESLEAGVGIEPAYTALQAAA